LRVELSQLQTRAEIVSKDGTGFSMKYSTLRKIILAAIISSVVLLAVTVGYRSSRPQRVTAAPPAPLRLADDVDVSVKGYRYQESNDKFQLQLAGSRSARRGRPILGLRSNLAKTIFFDSVHGKLKTAGTVLEFSARDGEWTGDLRHPFVLKDGVSLAINGKVLDHVQGAKIYFNRMTVETSGTNREIFTL
jgi:hypothetical protein